MSRRRPDPQVDPKTGMGKWVSGFRCACGKSAFLNRKAARGAMRRTFPGEAMWVYRCDRGPFQVWHFGHPWGYERER